MELTQRRRLDRTGLKLPYGTVLTARFKCSGSLELQAFVDACLSVLQRHEALRNTFHQAGAGYVQCRRPRGSLELYCCPGGARADAGEQFPQLYRPFDLQTGPFMRVLAVRGEAADPFYLEFAVEHFVADGYSLQLIIGEIGHYYNSLVGGTSAGLPGPAQAADYARWQQEELTGERITSIIDDWAPLLTADGAARDLPAGPATDMSRAPRVTEFSRTGLRPGWAQRLNDFASSEAVTPFSACAAIYARSMADLTGSDDVVFLSAFSGRVLQEHQNMVANVSRTIPLRIRNVSGSGCLADLAAEVMEAVAFGFDHQQLPSGMVSELLNERPGSFINLRGLPFFAVRGEPELKLTGVEAVSQECGIRLDAVLPHSSWLILDRDNARIETIYDPDLVSAETIRQLHSRISAAW